MSFSPLRLAAILLCALVAACESVPRGAGFQAEVLAVSDRAEDGTPLPDFAVAPVTRDLLPVYAAWPRIGERGYNWINRVEQPANRIIAPGDALTITIWNTEENGLLTAPGQRFVRMEAMRVSPSGFLFLPYIGEQKVSGMSPERAREVIEEKYVEVTPSAQVQVELAEGRQSTVSLVGGVAAPGVYPLIDRDITLLSMLAEAGGVTPSLRNPQVRLHRGGQVYGTSLDRLYENPSLNTTMVGGDRVIIEADERTFLSLGAAGTEAVHPFTKADLTAIEAMAIIGGVAESRADPQGILILRDYPASAVRSGGPSQERVVFTIDLTTADGLFSAGQFHIRPGDLVYASESPVTTAQTIFGILGSALGLGRQIAAAG